MIQNCPRRCPGLATPLSDLGNVLAISPMLYVQLRLGEVASPALVDSGAGDNFIDSGLVSPLQPKPLHLAVPTIIRSANGRPMDTCVVLVLPGFESVCHGFFTVCGTQKNRSFVCAGNPGYTKYATKVAQKPRATKSPVHRSSQGRSGQLLLARVKQTQRTPA